MVKQNPDLEKSDSDRMLKEKNTGNEARDRNKKDAVQSPKPPVHNNDSYIAPEKDQNDVLRRHE